MPKDDKSKPEESIERIVRPAEGLVVDLGEDKAAGDGLSRRRRWFVPPDGMA